MNIIKPYQGAWPPGDKEILIERNSLHLTGADLDDELLLETSGGQQRALTLSGLVHDMNQLPAQITGIPYGYVNRDTLEWLGLPSNFNELHILVAEDRFNKVHIIQVAEEVRDKIEKAGVHVAWTEVPEPGQHLVEEFMPTIVLLMTTLGLLALVLSAFLVVNVITAVVTQQQKQIGIMKSIGAKSTQITSVYQRMVLLLGLAALALAVPFSTLGAHQFSRFIASQLNFDLNKLRPSSTVIALEIVAGLLIPILAALYPVRHGTRVTVREAIQDYGLQQESSHQNPIDKLLARLPVSRPLRISLRNTFRRKGRLARTLITLMLGGAIFMSVITVILLIMAFLMVTVGALGLMGTMSINVLERTREIGVMRAIGASDGAVLRIFVVEGVIIGLLSWIGGILISQPMSRLISRQVGMAFLERPLDFQYYWLGPLYWLLIVLFISAVASLLPAYNAARLSVHETIAYE